MKSKHANSGATALWVIAVAVVLALLVFGVVSFSGVKNTDLPGTKGNTGTSGANCAQNPAISTTGVDALVASSNVTPANVQYIANGVFKGTYTSPVYGDKVTVLADPLGYLAAQADIVAGCGNNYASFNFYSYANATVLIKNDAGTAVLRNAVDGNGQNETQMTGLKNWQVTLTGNSQKSTGKMFFYLEMPTNSAANMSTAKLSCDNGVTVTPATIPNAIGSTGTNTYRTAFEVSALVDGAKTTCNLQASLIGGTTLDGAVYTKIYAEQKFVDTDGTVKEGIYNALNTAKYQDSYSYNFLIA